MENQLVNLMCRISETGGRLRVIPTPYCNIENAQIIATEAAENLQGITSELMQIIAYLNEQKKAKVKHDPNP